MAYTYEQGKEMQAEISADVDKWSAELQKFPKSIMGLTPDDVKKSEEFQNAKRNFDVAWAKQRLFNSGFVRRYKKEIHAEYRAKREAVKTKRKPKTAN